MKKILITQRLEKIGKFKEKRDNIDIRFVNFFNKIGSTLKISLFSNNLNLALYSLYCWRLYLRMK